MRTFILTFTLALAGVGGTALTEPRYVDTLLVLASDVSQSVDKQKFILQREGYATAVSNPEFVRVATAGPHKRIAIAYVEWASANQQELVVPWTIIEGKTSAEKLARELLERPRSFTGHTSISGALRFSLEILENAPYSSSRQIIDISGDGTNNTGPNLKVVRNDVLARGIIVNALVILSQEPSPWPTHTNPPGGLPHYFRENVAGGPGSFVVTAQGFESFGIAIRQKLIAEIAMR